MNRQSISMRNILFCAALLIGAAAATQAAAQSNPLAPQAPAAPATTPVPKILVIDRNAILQRSKVGQDIANQVKSYSDQAEKELKGESEGLRSEYQALQQQVAILSADVRQQKMAAFDAKQKAFQKKVTLRQDQIQGGVMNARKQVEVALGPILQGIMAERGANILLDRNAVVLGTSDIDVTQIAIQRLDQKLPTVKVTLVDPTPAELQAQQQQQEGQ